MKSDVYESAGALKKGRLGLNHSLGGGINVMSGGACGCEEADPRTQLSIVSYNGSTPASIMDRADVVGRSEDDVAHRSQPVCNHRQRPPARLNVPRSVGIMRIMADSRGGSAEKRACAGYS